LDAGQEGALAVGDAAAEVAPDEVAVVVDVVAVEDDELPPTVTLDRRAPARLELGRAAPKLDFK
jgi:hypothetical protein